MLFIRTKHSMQNFGVIPFIKLQNDTPLSSYRMTPLYQATERDLNNR